MIRSVSLALLTVGCAVLLASFLASAEDTDECDSQQISCFDEAEAKDDRCWERCERRGGDNLGAWERCTDRCSIETDRASNACDKAYDQCVRFAGSGGESASRSSRTDYQGSRKKGQDGCYFGECPEDIEGTIEDADPAPRTRRPTPSPSPQPQIQTTSICQTPSFWCQMGVRGGVGLQCYCNNPYGFPPVVNGVTVPEH